MAMPAAALKRELPAIAAMVVALWKRFANISCTPHGHVGKVSHITGLLQWTTIHHKLFRECSHVSLFVVGVFPGEGKEG